MKLKTFLRQAPLIAGAFATIFSVLFFVSCEASTKKKTEKKTPTLAFKLDTTDKGTTDGATAGTKFALEKKEGGVTKAGEPDKKVYYQVEKPPSDGARHFTLTASSESKGKVTYTLKKWTMKNGKPTLEDAKDKLHASKADLQKGKVAFKDNSVMGFFYLMAKQEAKGNYKAAKEVKALLVVGEVPVPDGAVVFDGVAVEGNGVGTGEGANSANLTVDKKAKTVTVTNPEDNKKFVVKVKVDYAKFPAHAPKYAPTAYDYDATTNLNANNNVETATKNADNNVVLVQGDSSSTTDSGSAPATEVKLALEKAAPYAAVTAFTVVTVDD